MLYKTPGIYVVDRYYPIFYQVALQVGAGHHTAVALCNILADECADLYAGGLYITLLHTIITDVGIVHDKYLSCIGRIRKHFLVTGHAGIKAKLSPTGAFGAKRFTCEIS